MKVSIVIPTTGSNPLLQKTLSSITALNYPQKNIQTITITNQEVEKSGKNWSFAAAVNQAAKKASGDYLLITNDDVILEKNSLKNWAAFAKKNPKNIYGARLLNQASKEKAASGYNLSLWTGIAKPVYCRDKIRICDWVSGCALFVSRDLWDRLKGLDEAFSPGYFEDADFCLRAKTIGSQCMLIPEARAQHAETTTFNRNRPKKYEYWYRNKLLFIKKHASPAQLATSIFLQYALFSPARAVIKRDGRLLPALKGLFWNLKNP